MDFQSTKLWFSAKFAEGRAWFERQERKVKIGLAIAFAAFLFALIFSCGAAQAARSMPKPANPTQSESGHTILKGMPICDNLGSLIVITRALLQAEIDYSDVNEQSELFVVMGHLIPATAGRCTASFGEKVEVLRTSEVFTEVLFKGAPHYVITPSVVGG